MNTTSGLRATIRVTAVGLFFALAGLSNAQEITAEHLKQARAAIASIGATNQFDTILPQAAEALKAEMIQKDPNLGALITTTVDNEVLSLVARRGDLENEAARVYAKVFTEAELKAIGEFYATDVGKKLLSDGPLATRQLVDAANIWQAGVARDLAQNVGEKMRASAPVEPAAPEAGAPEEKTEEAPKQ
ncbi:MAG: DUF2059 domain-containing protein [Rhizobiaceae bacterium]